MQSHDQQQVKKNRAVPEMVLPTARLVTVSFVVGAFAGLGLWGVAQAARPGMVGGIAPGVVGGVVGSVVGVLTVKPWVAKPLNRWPFLMLASQGVGFFATLFVSGLLYSTTRPDPLGLAAASVLTFVGAVIGHARVFEACSRSVGRAADPPSPG